MNFSRARRQLWWSGLAVAWALVACSDDDSSTGGGGETSLTVEELMQPQNCKDCHPNHYREWASSMHAYSSKDPIFRAMNARGQEMTNGELGDFCVRCHAPLAVATGAVTDGSELAEIDSEFASVNCYFCHNVASIEQDHSGTPKASNNPLQLAMDTTMRGSLADPAAVRPPAHDVAYSSLMDGRSLESAGMCGPCHDIVTDADVHLERTFAEWKANVVALPTTDVGNQASCNSCHMPTRGGLAADTDSVPVGFRPRLHSHLFPGIDTALTDDHPDRDIQIRAIECLLQFAGTIYYIQPEYRGVLRVVVETSAGHAFPSGATQDRRVWLEATVTKASGETVTYGKVLDDESVTEVQERARTETITYHDAMFDADGEVTHNFWEAASITSNAIPTATSPTAGSHTRENSIVIGPPVPTSEDAPVRIEVVMKARAVGREVVEDLLESGHLDTQYRDILDRLPTFTVEGTRVVWDAQQHQIGDQVRAIDTSGIKRCDQYYLCLLYPEDCQ